MRNGKSRNLRFFVKNMERRNDTSLNEMHCRRPCGSADDQLWRSCELYSEVEVASAEADVAAKKAKDAAIDVVRSSDGRAARAAMEEAAITNARLQNSLPRLRARMLEVLDAESGKSLARRDGELKARRDAVARRFR